MDFKSLPELLDHIKDEKSAIEYYEKLRWPDKPKCPHCNSDKAPYKANRKRTVAKNNVTKVIITKGYRCREKKCFMKFNVKTGTIFENSPIPMRLWITALYLATVEKKGISSIRLATHLGVTQKTAWYMLHRLRITFEENTPKMLGYGKTIEIDEAYIGGIESNKHKSRRRSGDAMLNNDGSPHKPKKVVIGMIERGGRVMLKYISNTTTLKATRYIEENVNVNSNIYTDESKLYSRLNELYNQKTIKHSSYEYVNGDVHTNSIENFWSVLKRGLYGTYHHVSEKHISKYLDEFSARFNTRKMSSSERLIKYLGQAEGNITHKNLTSNNK